MSISEIKSNNLVGNRCHNKIELAVLFWCYKDVEMCVSRLKLLRYNNQDIKIYVLFGGEQSSSAIFESSFKGMIDDFYCFPLVWEPRKKWMKGEMLIVDWFNNRGKYLKWDTLFIAQSDMLIFGNLYQLFGMLNKDELLLSGMRPLEEVEEKWGWTAKSNYAERSEYEQFISQLRLLYKEEIDIKYYCCLFVVACLSRSFLNDFANWEFVGLGFLEYSIPCFALAKGYVVNSCHDYNVQWELSGDEINNKYHLSATGREPSTSKIMFNLMLPGGSRIFHPVNKMFLFNKCLKCMPHWVYFLLSWIMYKLHN